MSGVQPWSVNLMGDETQPQFNNDSDQTDSADNSDVDLLMISQVEEAAEAIVAGASPAQLAESFGSQWSQLEPQVKLTADLKLAGADFRRYPADFDKAALLARFGSQLTPAQLPGQVADSGEQVAAVTPPASKLIPLASAVRGRRGLNRWGWPVRIAAAVLIFLVLSGSFAVAAQASNPGDLLYGAKLSLERAGEVLAFSPQAKAQAQVNFCAHRLQEMEALQNKGNYALIAQVSSEYISTLNNLNGQQLSPDLLDQLKAQRTRFTALQAKVPLPSVQTQLGKAISQLNQLNTASSTATPPGTAGVTVTVSISVTATFTPATALTTTLAAVSPTVTATSGTPNPLQVITPTVQPNETPGSNPPLSLQVPPEITPTPISVDTATNINPTSSDVTSQPTTTPTLPIVARDTTTKSPVNGTGDKTTVTPTLGIVGNPPTSIAAPTPTPKVVPTQVIPTQAPPPPATKTFAPAPTPTYNPAPPISTSSSGGNAVPTNIPAPAPTNPPMPRPTNPPRPQPTNPPRPQPTDPPMPRPTNTPRPHPTNMPLPPTPRPTVGVEPKPTKSPKTTSNYLAL